MIKKQIVQVVLRFSACGIWLLLFLAAGCGPTGMPYQPTPCLSHQYFDQCAGDSDCKWNYFVNGCVPTSVSNGDISGCAFYTSETSCPEDQCGWSQRPGLFYRCLPKGVFHDYECPTHTNYSSCYDHYEGCSWHACSNACLPLSVSTAQACPCEPADADCYLLDDIGCVGQQTNCQWDYASDACLPKSTCGYSGSSQVTQSPVNPSDTM